jgi:hypothetical protein
MQLVEDGHHVCRSVAVTVDSHRVGLANLKVGPVWYVDVSSGSCDIFHLVSGFYPFYVSKDDCAFTCTQADPVVEGVEGGFPAGEHVLVEVRAVLEKCVCLSRN